MSSPLERSALLTLVSLIRDREPDQDLWTLTDVPLRLLYDATCVMDPGGSYELQRRNHRQAMRRALGRLYEQGLICPIALGWCNVQDGVVLRWQGGGTGKNGETTPRWKLVTLTSEGIQAALALDEATGE